MKRALAILFLLSSACGTTRFQVQRRVPAEVNIPATKPMAVARIDGEDGDALVEALTQSLVATKRFQILERRNLQAAVAELKFNSEGFVSDETAMSFGNMTGASTLVVGEVLGAEYQENVSSAAAKCQRDGQQVDCTQFTRSAAAKLRVALKVIETESAKVLAAKSYEVRRDRSAQGTDAAPPEIAAKKDMLAECRKEIVDSFVTVVAPRDVAAWVVLREDGDLPELATGNNFAIVGNWTSAIEQYRAALAKAPNPELKAAALYDLGVALGYSGAFDEGISHVEQAFATDPNHLYREQVATLRQYKEDAARIAEQEGATPASK